MPLPKPTARSDWGVGNPDPGNRIVEPSVAKKIQAWNDDERPPAPLINWLFNNADEWLKYFESVTDELAATFDAVVATAGGNYTTLQAAIDAIAAPARIFVRDAFVVGTTIEINKAGLEVHFHPRATYSAGVATVGLRVSNTRCKVVGARLTDFTDGIEITAAAKNARVHDCNFSNVTNDIVDNGPNSVLANNLSEVP